MSALLGACNTAPVMPMASMDAQMKTMQAMHDKMMSAKTPQERAKLMAEHKKTMHDGMKMMDQMP